VTALFTANVFVTRSIIGCGIAVMGVQMIVMKIVLAEEKTIIFENKDLGVIKPQEGEIGDDATFPERILSSPTWIVITSKHLLPGFIGILVAAGLGQIFSQLIGAISEVSHGVFPCVLTGIPCGIFAGLSMNAIMDRHELVFGVLAGALTCFCVSFWNTFVSIVVGIIVGVLVGSFFEELIMQDQFDFDVQDRVDKQMAKDQAVLDEQMQLEKLNWQNALAKRDIERALVINGLLILEDVQKDDDKASKPDNEMLKLADAVEGTLIDLPEVTRGRPVGSHEAESSEQAQNAETLALVQTETELEAAADSVQNELECVVFQRDLETYECTLLDILADFETKNGITDVLFSLHGYRSDGLPFSIESIPSEEDWPLRFVYTARVQQPRSVPLQSNLLPLESNLKPLELTEGSATDINEEALVPQLAETLRSNALGDLPSSPVVEELAPLPLESEPVNAEQEMTLEDLGERPLVAISATPRDEDLADGFAFHPNAGNDTLALSLDESSNLPGPKPEHVAERPVYDGADLADDNLFGRWEHKEAVPGRVGPNPGMKLTHKPRGTTTLWKQRLEGAPAPQSFARSHTAISNPAAYRQQLLNERREREEKKAKQQSQQQQQPTTPKDRPRAPPPK